MIAGSAYPHIHPGGACSGWVTVIPSVGVEAARPVITVGSDAIDVRAVGALSTRPPVVARHPCAGQCLCNGTIRQISPVHGNHDSAKGLDRHVGGNAIVCRHVRNTINRIISDQRMGLGITGGQYTRAKRVGTGAWTNTAN